MMGEHNFGLKVIPLAIVLRGEKYKRPYCWK